MAKLLEPRDADWAPKFVQDLRGEAQEAIAGAEALVRDFMSRLVEQGHATHDETARAFRTTLNRMRQNREEMTQFLEGRLETMRKLLHVPSHSEVEKLQRRVASLDARLERLNSTIGKKN